MPAASSSKANPAAAGAEVVLPDVGSAGEPLALHKEAHRRLAQELATYQTELSPELERIVSAKALVTAQAEEITDLEKLDQLSIRIRSLELRESAVTKKAEQSEKWLQRTLVEHTIW